MDNSGSGRICFMHLVFYYFLSNNPRLHFVATTFCVRRYFRCFVAVSQFRERTLWQDEDTHLDAFVPTRLFTLEFANWSLIWSVCSCAVFSALTLLVGRQEGHPASKN